MKVLKGFETLLTCNEKKFVKIIVKQGVKGWTQKCQVVDTEMSSGGH